MALEIRREGSRATEVSLYTSRLQVRLRYRDRRPWYFKRPDFDSSR